MSKEEINKPTNAFYNILFNALHSEDLNSCITCDKFNTCSYTQNYLDYCIEYKYYMPKNNKPPIQKPRLIKSVYAKKGCRNRAIKIECIGENAINFITEYIGKYGKLITHSVPEPNYNNIKYYTLIVSNLYHMNDVLKYTLSYTD